jgi:sugar (pentulose or hexulose) kinase
MESLPEPPNPEMQEIQEWWEDIRILLRQFPAESFVPQSDLRE